ncbi:MAG: hypothetical protein ACTSYH_15505, partial [Candidatus Heimdallarchaeaceae archaeon]
MRPNSSTMIFLLYNYFPRRNISQLSIKEKDFSLKKTQRNMGLHWLSDKFQEKLALAKKYIYSAKF